MGAGVHAAVHDVVEELAVLRVLHDDEDAVGRLDDLVELRDGGVAHQFEDVQLARDPLHVRDVLDLLLLQDLDRHRLSRLPVHRLLHLPERPLPDSLPRSPQNYSIR